MLKASIAPPVSILDFAKGHLMQIANSKWHIATARWISLPEQHRILLTFQASHDSKGSKRKVFLCKKKIRVNQSWPSLDSCPSIRELGRDGTSSRNMTDVLTLSTRERFRAQRSFSLLVLITQYIYISGSKQSMNLSGQAQAHQNILEHNRTTPMRTFILAHSVYNHLYTSCPGTLNDSREPPLYWCPQLLKKGHCKITSLVCENCSLFDCLSNTACFWSHTGDPGFEGCIDWNMKLSGTQRWWNTVQILQLEA